MKVEEQMEEKGREVEWWLAKNGIPERTNKDIKRQIMKKVQQELEENRDADLDGILPILHSDIQDYIKSCMPLTRLKQVNKYIVPPKSKVQSYICILNYKNILFFIFTGQISEEDRSADGMDLIDN